MIRFFCDLETVIHAFISTRLDYCNALYAGINQSSLSRLQLIENTVACFFFVFLTGIKKREHIKISKHFFVKVNGSCFAQTRDTGLGTEEKKQQQCVVQQYRVQYGLAYKFHKPIPLAAIYNLSEVLVFRHNVENDRQKGNPRYLICYRLDLFQILHFAFA